MKKKKNKKTIAIFSGYALPHLGGIERYTHNLAKQLIELNYNVIIVSSDYDFSKQYFIQKDNIVYLKLPVYKLFVSRYPIMKKNKEFKETLNLLNRYDISAIIVNTRFHLTTLTGAKYAKQHSIPVFLIEHGSQHLTVDNKILDFFGAIYEHALTALVKKYVDKYYGVSLEACLWQRHFKINSNGVWYNSINDFSEGIKLNKEKEKKINILYAGRILKQKGIIELLEAFSKLEKKYKNIHLSIAGDGNLLNLVKAKYVSKQITFLGKVDFEHLKELYSYTDIFVYAPNWPEGLPTSILEAGLMNCAVIASPQGGIKEIIENGQTGVMIKNEEELLEALELLITNREKREILAKKLKEKVQTQFLWKNTAKKVIKDINAYK